MSDHKYSLGIDIGGTNTVFGLVAASGQIIKKDSILTNSSKAPDLLFENIFNKIKVCNANMSPYFESTRQIYSFCVSIRFDLDSTHVFEN